ncbi:phytanoyl-CoA dioxygenase family protein [Jiulongibacter sediminis]|uniref:Phytanoyl-CoA dioxygenase n=1 Tax=Jiulongibacter sediminis TaxID=1605367 RepID=A0A0P7BKJ6_9BACT|nr:phytanoyl-CoA dioxygenase family protein [Jiulongibacter sediminis]KPM47785.1 phytanoyl-CoA dioxygenase [Jiulongibacter sediminis]TBX23969.1 phytanoyl-CoA dioxygenase [Jiulongibacter sediminis]
MSKLSEKQLNDFIDQGYLRLDGVFDQQTAEEARKILWEAMGVQEATGVYWKEPVIYLGDFAQKPFREAANSERLAVAFDQLVGQQNWIPRMSLGSFPIRFPSLKEPGDTGWHVDASFPGDEPGDYMKWRINICSKNRGLLMLFLFSDVTAADAPTRIRVGSHLDVARILKPFGKEGLSFTELSDKLGSTSNRKEIFATGEVGTVYLCHPFLVHAAQKHLGQYPKFMAQPPLFTKNDLSPLVEKEEYPAVEMAIRRALKV